MSSQLATTQPEITDLQIQRESAAFDMLQRQAKMFSSSSLVPKEFQGSLANCAIGINIAKRLGADPFMVLQNIDIIHGRPSFRATFLIAMVNAAGRFEPLQFRMDGTEGKPDRSCIAWTKSKADGATLEGPKITMEMAKAEGWSTKAGSKWLTMPELMLRYRAAAFFARLYAPDITLGMMIAEEAQDMPVRDVTPPSATTSPLFKDVPAKPIYKDLVNAAENADSPAASNAGQQNESAALFDTPDISPLEAVLTWMTTSGVKWATINETLYWHGVTSDLRTTPEDCGESELRDILGMKSQLEAVKGGKK